MMERTKNLVLMALFTALIAVGAFIRIPIPVIPFTLQVFFTTLAGILLGKKYGTLSVVAYVCIGLIGIPVFTNGGGPSYLFQPTFGYLIGFCIGTFVTGAIAHQVSSPSMKRLLAANFCGLILIYLCGMVYYWFIASYYLDTEIGLWTLFLYCFLMTIAGDIVSCIFAAFLGKRLIPILHKNKSR